LEKSTLTAVSVLYWRNFLDTPHLTLYVHCLQAVTFIFRNQSVTTDLYWLIKEYSRQYVGFDSSDLSETPPLLLFPHCFQKASIRHLPLMKKRYF